MNTKTFIFILTLLISGKFFSQDKKIDSLLKTIKGHEADTVGAKTYQKIARAYMAKGLFDSGFVYAKKTYGLSKKINFTKGVATSCNAMGQIYNYKGSFDSALYFFTESMRFYEVLNDTSNVAGMLNNIGLVYKAHGNISKALDYFFKSLRKKEKIKDTFAIASAYLNIGHLYHEADDSANTLKYYKAANEMCKKINSPSLLSNSYTRLGNFYQGIGNSEKALPYLLDALKISRQLEDEDAIAIGLYNLATIYYRKNNINEAEKMYNEALGLSRKNKNYEGIATCQMILGEMRFNNNETEKAIKMFEEAYEAGKTLDAKDLMCGAAYKLSYAFDKTKNYQKAFIYHKIWSALKDSLYNLENIRKLTSEGLKYEYEKEKITLQKEEEKKEAIRKAESLKKDLILWASILFLLTVSIFSLIIFKRLKENRRQKNIIEQQRNEMIDSINYARRIQFALLAHADLLKNNLPEHFILFKPKDIVSGDFYWATLKDDYFYLAICDSTGHGVPGAFMSLLNISFLNEAINEKNITEPHLVLNHVRKRLLENMDGGNDGMDAVLIKIPRSSAHLRLEYAAANNSPLLIRNGEIIELPKDKMPVGKGERTNDFNLHTIQLQKDDHLYLYTDGFADQFGGPKGKKFKHRELHKLLLSNNNNSLSSQENNISAAFDNWKGKLEQVDDVCVVGIKI